ncbi:ATP-dependent helicase ['Fragaria x ananassa' phyllody phytoplasma]|uniref:ATP-dependent helicase n=1 Tax='Fragaria x ananassa' phyllody phytoplasma TaxID=2358428 RepID=A0ABS5K3I9_9MOLU|nr:ATP-dependent helicase ['Fragaria x ananassa' phyllody phytoplasma]
MNQDILKINKLFSYFYYKYITYLKDNNLMDFDDLNKYAYQLLLDNQNILNDLQNKYEYILIDEIQDIDFYQYQLIKLLAQNTILFIVGDLNQSIYGFRGSKNIYIELLQKDFNMLTFYLKTNYRSCNEITKISNSLIDEKYRLVSFLNNNSKVYISPFY